MIKTKMYGNRLPTVGNYLEAARRGNLEEIKHCLSCGIPIDAQNTDIFDNSTALATSAMWGHLNVVEHLVRNGANPFHVAVKILCCSILI